MDKLKSLLRSWKTTSSGLLVILLALTYGILVLHDGVQSGDIDKLQILIPLFPVGIGLICSKDGDKSSEDLKLAEAKIKELGDKIKGELK